MEAVYAIAAISLPPPQGCSASIASRWTGAVLCAGARLGKGVGGKRSSNMETGSLALHLGSSGLGEEAAAQVQLPAAWSTKGAGKGPP